MLPLSSKTDIRRDMRVRRRDYAASLDGDTRAALEAGLAEVLAPLFATATVIAAYHPMKDEISPLPAMANAAAAGLTIGYPFFVDRDSRMTFRTGNPVDPGPWGILQPEHDSEIVSPDLILMPLVAIDAGGNRVGMGKGHYDRALPGLREAGARLIGVGWEFQRIEQLLTPDPGTCRSTASLPLPDWRCTDDRAELAQARGDLRDPSADYGVGGAGRVAVRDGQPLADIGAGRFLSRRRNRVDRAVEASADVDGDRSVQALKPSVYRWFIEATSTNIYIRSPHMTFAFPFSPRGRGIHTRAKPPFLRSSAALPW